MPSREGKPKENPRRKNMTYQVVIRHGSIRKVISTGMDEIEACDLAEYYEWHLLGKGWHVEIEEEE